MRPALIARAVAPAVRRVAVRPSVATFAPLASSSILPRAFSSTPPALKKGGKEKGGKGKGKKSNAAEEGEEGLSEEDIAAIVSKIQGRMQKATDWAKTFAFEGVERGRGRVSPALLDSVKVATADQGSVPLKSIASITVKNHALYVEVWDPDQMKAVDTAVNKANIPGLSPQREGNALHIPISRPTSEVRAQVLKSIHDTVEAAKAQVRVARTDGLKALGGRGEDGTDKVQEAMDKASAEFDSLLLSAKKELAK